MARTRQDESRPDAAEGREPTPPTEGAEADDVTGPVLLFNSRGGVYQCTYMRPLPRGSQESQQQYEPQSLRVPPGLYLVQDVELWRQVRQNPGLLERIEDGEIRILGGIKGLRAPDDWTRMKPKVAAALVQETSDIGTLRTLLEVEKRDEVADALQMQIDECTSDGQQRQNARRAQRAHNRGPRRVP